MDNEAMKEKLDADLQTKEELVLNQVAWRKLRDSFPSHQNPVSENSATSKILEWLIIGGGPHGTHMAICLIDKGVHRDFICILDPSVEPLARWRHQTANTGMTHLRSPRIHNIDVNPYALRNYAQTDEFINIKCQQTDGESIDEPDFIPPYSRPSVRLFMHHVQSVIEETGLMSCWKTGEAESIRACQQCYQVQTKAGEQIKAKNVVLAIGMGMSLS